MNSLDDIEPERRAEILAARLERSERALLDAEKALEQRMRDLVHANEELSKSESELAARLDIESALLLGALATAGMVTIYGERDRGYTISQGGGAMLGLPAHQEAGLEDLMAALHPLDRQRITREGMAFFREKPAGQDHHYAHRIVRADTGETRWLSWSVRRERSTPERPGYVMGTVRDVTEARANERRVRALQLLAERRVRELEGLRKELQAAKDTAEGALEDRVRFISEMAHAVRTPLSGLAGGLDLVSGKLAADDSDLKVVREASEQLGQIAARLLEEADANDPTGPDLAGAPVPLPSRSDAIPESPRVLVAEDTESNRYVIRRLLEEMNCEVVAVENGAAAVEEVRRSNFDCILMDVMMPIMDGEQATKAIRALPGSVARVPIIGITAHSLAAERDRLVSSGMTVCLAKPVRRDALENAVKTAIISGRGGSEAHQARFDHDLFRRGFTDLPPAYRERMRTAARKDITRYATEVLTAAHAQEDEQLSRMAHSLTGVALNVGAIGIVEELARFREERAKDPAASPEAFRAEVAACLLAIDDLYDALVGDF
ncbi:response regulator [Alteriqipengyuania sp. 357]